MVTAEPGVDAGGVGAAATMLGTVGELDDVLAILDGAKFENARQADDARAVNAGEAGRVEALLEGLHGFAQKMSSRPGVEFAVVAGSGNPIDIVDGDDLEAGAGTDGEARDVGIAVGIRRSYFVREGRSESAPWRGLRLLLGVFDAEVEIAPEIEKRRGLDAGFEEFHGIGRGDDEAADKER